MREEKGRDKEEIGEVRRMREEGCGDEGGEVKR